MIYEGTSQEHTLHSTSDYDYMMFNATSGYTYVMETSSTVDNTDTYMTLYDTDGVTELTYNDDYSGLQSRISWTCTSTGTYYIEVKGYNGAEGRYSILLLSDEPTPTPGPTATPEPGTDDWTIMVYLDADNNLEPYGIEDLNEMEAVNLAGTGVNVIVLLDRISGYDTSNGDWTDTRIYEVTYDPGGVSNNTIVSTELQCTELGLTVDGYEELNLGDSAVCEGFISFCKTQYAADNYFLIYWNHGSGWRKQVEQAVKAKTIDIPLQPIGNDPANRAVCYDDTSGHDALYTKEIGDSLVGQGIDVVGFDACLQQMIEVVYEIRNDVSYVIGSEETEGADGWEYDTLLSNFIASGMTQMDLVNAVVDAYETRYGAFAGATLSGVDCTQVDALMTALNNFSDALAASITNSTIQLDVASTIFNNTESFYDTSTGDGDYNIDIWDMADVIETAYDYVDTEAAALKTAVENAIAAEWHHTGTGITGNPNATGLAIYYVSISEGSPEGHSYEYMRNYTWTHPLAFVADTTWNMNYNTGTVTGPGLLYTLFYQTSF
jgi:predicted lipoprotein with Yx(FWY)xxD motif